MAIKHLYAVGDSFTFGDELLDSVIDKHIELQQLNIKNFNIIKLNEIYRSSQPVYRRIVEIKDKMTYAGKIAEMLNCEFINYAQSGSAIDSILFQLHFVVNDIRERNLDPKECFVIVGLTSPYRKSLIDVHYMNEYLPRDFIIRSTSGSVMIAQPDNSVLNSKPLAEAIGKYISIDQLITEFVFQLTNIDNLLTRFGTPFLLANVWNHSFMKDIENAVTRKFCIDALDMFKTVNKIYPGYPDSLLNKIPKEIYHANLVTENGHPNEEIHRLWAEMLLPTIKELSYEMDQKDNKQN